jgi:hypothetical protein
VGDLLIAWASNDVAGGTWTPPAGQGWTAFSLPGTESGFTSRAWYKRVDATDASRTNYTFTFSSSEASTLYIAAFYEDSGVGDWTLEDGTGWAFTAAGNTLSNDGVTAVDNSLFVVGYGNDDNEVVTADPSGPTKIDEDMTAGTAFAAYFEMVDAIDGSVSYPITWGGTAEELSAMAGIFSWSATPCGPGTLPFLDDFNRLDNTTVGNCWTETEPSATAESRIGANRLVIDNLDDINEPIVQRTFTQQVSGFLRWTYIFNWAKDAAEVNYELWMQLGDSAAMVDPAVSDSTGVAVNLKWASPSYGMTNQAGFGYVTGNGSTTQEVQVLNGGGDHTIEVIADLDSNTFDLIIDGTPQAADVPFDNNVPIDAVRIYTDEMDTSNGFTATEFDDIFIEKIGPAVTSAVAEIAPNDVPTGSTATPYTYDILPTIGASDTGVNQVEITVPNTFGVPTVTGVKVGGTAQIAGGSCPTVAAGEYCATVVGQDITVTLGTKVTVDATNIQVQFTADAPGTADPIGQNFFSTVDDSGTPPIPQGTSENNADGDGGDNNSWTVTTTDVVGSCPIDVRISADSDDSEETISSGSIDWTSSDLELGEQTGGSPASAQIVGMRFPNLAIPQGATITNAYIQFTVDEADVIATDLTYTGELTVNAATFQNVPYDLSNRLLNNTAASVSWNGVPAWNNPGDATLDQRTPNLASIIQEIVNQGTWSRGNALVIFVTGTGERTAESHNGVPAAAPLLHVECSAAATGNISGTVFEDINYGGGDGRDYVSADTSAQASGWAAGAIGAGAVEVELYENQAGNYIKIDNTTTDAAGAYTFSGVADGTYRIRVVNDTVVSNRGPNGTGFTPFAVQTFRNDPDSGGPVVNEVGGANPAAQDAVAQANGTDLSTITAQSVTEIAVSGVNVNNVDFGFNFDTIVNDNDAGQGSLRQFIRNSNELDNVNLDQQDNPAGVSAVTKNAGYEHSLFMISVAELVATIDGGGGTVMLIQPASVLPIIIDTYTAVDGSTQTAYTGDTNSAVAETTTGPEVIIDLQGFVTGEVIEANANFTIVDSLGLTGPIGGGANGVEIEVGITDAIIRNNTIWDTDASSFKLESGASNNQILNNVMRNSGLGTATADGIAFGGNNDGNTISGNQLISHAGYGIDVVTPAPDNNNTITSNLIKDSGTGGTQLAGIALRNGNNNTISLNTITQNAGEGIMINTGNIDNLITQNSIYDNTGLGIDLSAGSAETGDGVTANDVGDGDSGANNLQNYPMLSSADSIGGNTTIVGTLNSTASTTFTIEFFSSTVPDPSGNGEGEVYLGSDTVTTDGSGNANINTVLGVAVAAGDVITATATDPSNNTSEFSAAVIVTTGGLLSHWPLDEAAGLTADEIILNNDGTYQNGVTLNQPGACASTGTAVSFNSALSQYVEIPHSDAYLLDEGTITFWAQATGTAANQGLFSKDSTDFDTGGHLTIRLLVGGAVEVRLQDTTGDHTVQAGSVNPGTWFYVAFSWGLGGMNLYVDGAAPATDPYTGGLGTTSGGAGNFEPIVLGANSWGSGDLVATPTQQHLDGSMDDVRIYNRAVVATAAIMLQQTLRPRPPAGPPAQLAPEPWRWSSMRTRPATTSRSTIRRPMPPGFIPLSGLPTVLTASVWSTTRWCPTAGPMVPGSPRLQRRPSAMIPIPGVR